MANNTIYVAWRNCNANGGWYVIGALEKEEQQYNFHYTNGVKVADGFSPFSGMTDLAEVYKSESLFPLFANRLLSKNRPEYPKLIKWMGFSDSDPEPIEMLGLTRGIRATDQFEMFNKINVLNDGSFEHVFFAHGFKHFPDRAQNRIRELYNGEELKLVLDKQNDFDPHAVLIRTKEPNEIFAYCPSYIAKNVHDLLSSNPSAITVRVELVNIEAPESYQLLCKLTGKVDINFKFMDDYEYKPYRKQNTKK